MSTAAIVVIGNEVLSAKVLDENGPFLARELRALGVEVRRIETVPDEVPLIVDALRRCLGAAQWVFTSGGIGPTHDDVTIAAVASAFGRRTVVDERTLSLLLARYGDQLKPALRRLAEVPEGATLTWGPGPGPSYPVLMLDNVVILPGVPSLLREGFFRVRDRFRGPPIFSCTVFLSLGEGALAEHLDATVARFPAVAIGSYPRFATPEDPAPAYRVKVTFDGRGEAEVKLAAAFFVARLPDGAVLPEE